MRALGVAVVCACSSSSAVVEPDAAQGSATPGAIVYTNLTGRHTLAALAPDRPGCSNAQPTPIVARNRVIALDDPLASHVDYTNCPDQRPEGAPLAGSWVQVPNSHVRILPVC